MNAKAWMSLAAVLFVVWLLAVVAFKVVGAAIHLVLVAAVLLLIAGVVRMGARRLHT
ncbi:DUF5670 family protein [Archangium violaceum]|uniref:DUF5670 family protein n=1 Tax=Archangium violaceum TaxID=83451 RepID=UPI0037C0C3B0